MAACLDSRFFLFSAGLSILSWLTLPAAMAAIAELSPVANGQLVRSLPAQQLERHYPLGPATRIAGRLRLEDALQVSGELQRETYELEANHAGLARLDHERRRLQAQGALLLYWCEGRECGASSVIANELLGEATLYGPDKRQGLVLLQLDERTLLTLYTITRGNRRAYLHAERLHAAAPLPTQLPIARTLLKELLSAGELRLPVFAETPDAVWPARLAAALALNGDVAVVLGGEQAGHWQAALTAAGVPARRLSSEPGRPAGLYRRS